jgi:hypothetical protein
MVYVETIDELINKIRDNGAIVYGTGYVARKIISSFQKLGLSSSIHVCVTTKKDKDIFMGYRVIGVEELARLYHGELVCIAVHEAIKNEVIMELDSRDISNYLWIYPFQLKLRYGEPVEQNVEVDIKRIIETTQNGYSIAIRFAAIEQYYGHSDSGYNIYVKTQSIHCGVSTATERLNAFVRLIKSWDEQGFDAMHRPAISEKYEILDGLHRITLAKYNKMPRIACDFYRITNGENPRDERVDITSSVLINAGITDAEEFELQRCYQLIYE